MKDSTTVPSPESAGPPARELARELKLDERIAAYRDHRWEHAGGAWPTLYLDDVSAIPFLVDIAGVEEYQHRARVRAGDGDLYAAVTPPTQEYETYCRGKLALGRPDLLLADPGRSKLAVTEACSSGTAFDLLVDRTRRAGGLFIHPYMSIQSVWELARALASEAQAPVEVVGPPPPVTWVANDKRVFGELVKRILGDAWWVPTAVSDTPRGLTRHLLEMAERHERVGLKRTRCASAMGNVVYDSRRLREQGRRGVERLVRRFLDRTEWDGSEEVLAVAWEETELSPSSQTWCPAVGPPRVEGIYEQILTREEGVFVGSRPSTLPEKVNARVTEVSRALAAGLQALGYVGRCSFDFLVLGDPRAEFHIKLTECNGRWGGTSIPMHLVDRLVPGPRPPYRAQDYAHPDLVGVPFREILARVGDALYDPGTGRGRFVFYNVGPLARWGKLDVIAFGDAPDEAEEAVLRELPARLRLRRVSRST